MDVKPSLSNGGNGAQSSVPKQREGTNMNSNSSGTGSSNTGAGPASAGASNGGLFDVSQHPYNGYENGVYGSSGSGAGGGGYGNHQGGQANAFQSGGSAKMSSGSMNSPHSKPQRTKSRTNAGKTLLRHGVG